MTHSPGFEHLVRRSDGIAVGLWREFTLESAFQPIFSFAYGRLEATAFEGLLRPFRNGEAVAPMPFFARVPPMERLHIETLARTLHLLNAGACLDPAASIFINFDPSLFVERAVSDMALRDMRLVLHEAGIAPTRVVCEVTEQKSGSRGALFDFLETLRERGLRIAVDDYGSDDSDIRRIEELRPDIVKFDGRLVDRLMGSGAGFALLQKLTATFEARGTGTVLEGIEEGWQIELAEKSGAAMVQGFALARPELAPTSFARFAGKSAGPSTPALEIEAAALAATIPARPGSRVFGRKPG